MKKIYATTWNIHDHNYYDGDYHFLAERTSRVKMNHCMLDPLASVKFHNDYFKPQYDSRDEVIAFTYTGGGLRTLLEEGVDPRYDEIVSMGILEWEPTKLWDHLFENNIYYTDHHCAHAASTFLASGYEEADILAIDGGGSRYRTVFFDKEGTLRNMTAELPVGWVWNTMCIAVGLETTQSGKLMGMAGYGKVNEDLLNTIDLFVDTISEVHDRGPTIKDYRTDLVRLVHNATSDQFDIAATVQEWTYRRIAEVIPELQTSNNLCLAGGVSYNGYMNERLLRDHYDQVYVPISPGDEGQAVGVYMHADYVLNDNIHTPNIYSGKAYDLSEDELKDLLNGDKA